VKRGESQTSTATEDPATVTAESGAQQTKDPSRAELAEAARARAMQFMADKQFAQARKALEEAEALEAAPVVDNPTGPRKVLAALRWRLNRNSESGSKAKEEVVVLTSTATVDKSVEIVELYSKIAAVVGLLPGNILNFAAILAVMVTMVWRIAATFGQSEGKNRIKGSIMALVGAAIPTGVGHGIAAAVIAIPAVIAGSVLYFLVTPVLAYALTKAVGNTFVMHFESGGTLLNFDPKGFQEYFLKEFQEAGGQLKAS
jgi:uncharacterized protein (DUF697 family)